MYFVPVGIWFWRERVPTHLWLSVARPRQWLMSSSHCALQLVRDVCCHNNQSSPSNTMRTLMVTVISLLAPSMQFLSCSSACNTRMCCLEEDALRQYSVITCWQRYSWAPESVIFLVRTWHCGFNNSHHETTRLNKQTIFFLFLQAEEYSKELLCELQCNESKQTFVKRSIWSCFLYFVFFQKHTKWWWRVWPTVFVQWLLAWNTMEEPCSQSLPSTTAGSFLLRRPAIPHLWGSGLARTWKEESWQEKLAAVGVWNCQIFPMTVSGALWGTAAAPHWCQAQLDSIMPWETKSSKGKLAQGWSDAVPPCTMKGMVFHWYVMPFFPNLRQWR